MPSWNIHTAHVEGLLAHDDLATLGIRDANAFLFGNFVPDVYVGYMVRSCSHKIRYRITHLAEPDFIPTPHFDLFAALYVDGLDASDVTLGTWAHLVADHIYNLHTSRYIQSIGVPAGEQTRIRKQGDFDLFGRTLRISLKPQVTEGLLAQAAAFPQYGLDAADVRAAAEAACDIVDANAERQVDGTPEYSLLTADFFAETSAEVSRVIRAGLAAHAACGSTAPGVAEVMPGYLTMSPEGALEGIARVERMGAESERRMRARGRKPPFDDEVVPVHMAIPNTPKWQGSTHA